MGPSVLLSVFSLRKTFKHINVYYLKHIVIQYVHLHHHHFYNLIPVQFMGMLHVCVHTEILLCMIMQDLFSKQGEASGVDQPPPGSHLRNCGEHSLCEGVWVGGGDGDHNQEHQAVSQ